MQGININNNNNNQKDTMNVTYLDVTYHGEPGRISLQSDSMAFFAAASDQTIVIPWNSVGKLHTGAMKSTATGKEEYLLKIIMARGPDENFVFGMNQEPELDRIREDIQRLVKAYNSSHTHGSIMTPASGLMMMDHSSTNGSDTNSNMNNKIRSSSALVVPPPTTNDSRNNSLTSVISRGSVSMVSAAGSKQGNSKEQPFQDEESLLMSNHSARSKPHEITVMASDDDRSHRSGSTASTDHDSILSGSTTRSPVASPVRSSNTSSSNSNRNLSTRSHQNERDPETGLTRSSSKSIMMDPKASFQKDSADMPPLATYRLVPDQGRQMDSYIYPTKEVLPPKKMWHSKWFWLAMVFVALLLMGIGIGIGMLGINAANNNDKNQAPANEVVGMQDATIVPVPSSAPSEAPTMEATANATTDILNITNVVVASAQERPATPAPVVPPTFAPITRAPTTPLPTNAPTEPGCSGVPHGVAVNQRANAIVAGNYGGSTFCRASMISICKATEWIQFSKFTGTSSAWFVASAYDDSFCAADVEHKVRLEVPRGVDYDVHVYEYNSPIPHDSAMRGGEDGGAREVVISAKEVFGDILDVAFTYYIHVEYKSGASCEPWVLSISGHECL
ncbi:expressed unknown protein [Seminavis robusta]|uniref:Uncharacterized protein n=1 Tax=Seminavis robusta TaxID=568900 RepID=A0A9N8EN20_9STRA|nr:expressed unknown protein [Seminavis robusta]|eukprot:Sro1256_g256660.1 n/a (619) ;mRNA; r:24402-26343